MNDKRGITEIVTTILIILVVLAAIVIVWVAVRGLLSSGSNQISLGGVSIDLVIKSATINSSTGIATIKVSRNPGVVNETITAVKFIVADSRNSDVFTVQMPNGFPELTTRTFEINLTTSKILNLSDIQSIQVAPVYLTGSGAVQIGQAQSTYPIIGGGNISVKSSTCMKNSDCGTNGWVSPSYCNSNTTVARYWRNYTCVYGTCTSSTSKVITDTCSSPDICYAGNCTLQKITCTPQTVVQDCGQNTSVGFPYCNQNPPPEQIRQDYSTYSCINDTCVQGSGYAVLQNCSTGQVCGMVNGAPKCFTPNQCASNADCQFGQICVNGNCTQEYAAINGTVYSSWPPGINVYFDGAQLPRTKGNVSYSGYTVIFPGSNQTTCLSIKNYYYPPSTSYYAYIELNQSPTNVSGGDNFQLWQTSYGCTKI
jgi:hypothetical protein